MRMKMKIKINSRFLTGLLLLVMMAACSTTKHLPEDELLYIGTPSPQIVGYNPEDEGEATLEEVQGALNVAPNNSFFGSPNLRIPFPLGLWVYNRFERYEKGIGKWIFKKLAADPIYVSTVNPETRTKIASNLLRENGFFQGNVTVKVDTAKNPKKAKLLYTIYTGQRYKLDSISYVGFSGKADTLIQKFYEERLLKKEDDFSVNKLNEERNRLVELFRNNGYYYYRSDFISFLADTLIRPGYVNLKIVQKQNIPEEGLQTYYIGNTKINLIGHNGELPEDSLNFHNFTIRYAGKRPGIRYGVLRRRFLYRSGETYSQIRQDYTQQALSRLGVFKFNDFKYTPRRGTDTLDIDVNAMFDLPYDSELELNVTTKSTKQTGPGAKFNLSKKNFKRMGASLNLELSGSYEWQTSSTVDGESSVMNSYELGAALSLNFPRLILPWIRNRVDPFRFPSETNFKIYAEQLNRARYFKMLSFGGTVSYSFQPKRSIKHTVTPLHLAFNTLQNRTARFDSIANANPMLFHSLDDQFIPSLTYTVTYDNSYRKKKSQVWWENSLTSAGNVTSMIYAAFGQKFSTKEKKLLGTPFAQFLKYSSEVRFLHHISEKQQVAARLMGGVIWAYGNKTIAPYSEQFYVGGANSIRAFTVRSIGPGRFHPTNTASYSYVDETGDIKLEANLEYRFRILSNFMGGNLNGATFLDAGNVWLMRKDEARPEAEFSLNNFFDSIALGTGVGLRYDLSFLILRLDFGIALHVPYDTGKSGYYNIPRFKDGMGIHFAIGYPF